MKVALNLSQTWPEIKDIYDVGYHGSSIGRVWLARDRGERAWNWHISIPMQLPDDTQGEAGSLNEALNALAVAFGKLVATTPPARFDRAMKFLHATNLRGSDRSSLPAGPAATGDGPAASRIVRGAEQPAPDAAPAQAEPPALPMHENELPTPEGIRPEPSASPSPQPAVVKRIRRIKPGPALPEASRGHPSREDAGPPKTPAAATAAATPPEPSLPILLEGGGTSMLRDLQRLLARHA